MRIYGVRAPPSRNDEYDSSPFAFAAKEYLRKMVAGQSIQFRSYKIETMSYGYILFNGKNIALDMLAKGYLLLSNKVEDKFNPSDFDRYQDTFSEAKESQVGIHGGTYDVNPKLTLSPKDMYRKFKGNEMDGFLDQITFENDFEYFLFDTMNKAVLRFAGITFPIIGASFSKKLKVYVYKNLSNKDSSFKLLPMGEDGQLRMIETDYQKSLLKQLLLAGFGELSAGAEEVVGAELAKLYAEDITAAKSKQVGFWAVAKTAASRAGSGPSGRTFTSQVVEANSGDSITVTYPKNGTHLRIFFSNLRAPKMGNFARNTPGEDWAFQAREYLRKSLVGKKVRVILEYKKKIEIKQHDGETYSRELQCATVFDGDRNVSELILEKGLAKFMTPREGEEHTSYLVSLSEAEKKGISSSSGIYSKKTPPTLRLWDLSVGHNKKKTKTEFRIGETKENLEGIIEMVLDPTRLKVRIDSKNAIILLQINGLRSVKSDQNMPGNEGFSQKAILWARERFSQRTVSVEIENVDKHGNCHGTVYFKGANISHQMLEEGFAYIKSMGRPTRHLNWLIPLEKKARAAKAGLWGQKSLVGIEGDLDADYEDEVDETPFRAQVSEYISPFEFYVQTPESSKIEQIQEGIAEYHDKLHPLVEPVNRDTWCLAPFDGCLFRCRVLRHDRQNDTFDVFFVDFGNVDNFPIDELKMMPPALNKFKPQATKCSLAYIKTFSTSNVIGEDASILAKKLMWEKAIVVTPQYRLGGSLYVLVNPAKKQSTLDSINYYLLEDGLAILDRDYPLPTDEMVGAWSQAESNGLEDRPELQELVDMED